MQTTECVQESAMCRTHVIVHRGLPTGDCFLSRLLCRGIALCITNVFRGLCIGDCVRGTAYSGLCIGYYVQAICAEYVQEAVHSGLHIRYSRTQHYIRQYTYCVFSKAMPFFSPSPYRACVIT